MKRRIEGMRSEGLFVGVGNRGRWAMIVWFFEDSWRTDSFSFISWILFLRLYFLFGGKWFRSIRGEEGDWRLIVSLILMRRLGAR